MKKRASFVAVFIFLLSGLAFGQIRSRGGRFDDYTIRGRILFSTGHDIDERLEVRLEKTALQVIATTYTDSIGNFEFRNLQPGMYFIAVSTDGYDEVRQAIDLYSSVNGLTSVSIFLTKKDGSRDSKSALDSADPDIIDVSQIKENFPKKAVQNYEKAVEEMKKGQNDRAIKLLEESLQIAPNFFRAHNDLGLLYQRAKRYREAEKEYRRCHELVPKSAQPLTNLGSLFVQEAESRKDETPQTLGKILDQALDALEEAVKLNSHSAIAYYYLGAANFKSSFLEEAEAALKKSRELDPNLGMVRLMLANVYMKQNKWNDVLENLDAYIQENPKASDRASIEEMRAKIAKGLEAAK